MQVYGDVRKLVWRKETECAAKLSSGSDEGNGGQRTLMRARHGGNEHQEMAETEM